MHPLANSQWPGIVIKYLMQVKIYIIQSEKNWTKYLLKHLNFIPRLLRHWIPFPGCFSHLWLHHITILSQIIWHDDKIPGGHNDRITRWRQDDRITKLQDDEIVIYSYRLPGVDENHSSSTEFGDWLLLSQKMFFRWKIYLSLDIWLLETAIS